SRRRCGAGADLGRASRCASENAEGTMSGWFLERLEIEGVRGINNEGDPLVLSFAHDAVNSVSAPNGVGKSSIFDALTYALRKKIPKLDELPATESGDSYYLNRFHSKNTGTIR
ncbi:DNA repair exonuclease SbcCD ATPase subunit, partial [Bradyrhizobium japonicum]